MSELIVYAFSQVKGATTLSFCFLLTTHADFNDDEV